MPAAKHSATRSKPTRGKPNAGKETPKKRRVRLYRNELMLLLTALVLLLAGVWIRLSVTDIGSDFAYLPDDNMPPLVAKGLQQDLEKDRQALTKLDDDQAKSGIQVASGATTQARLDQIDKELKQQQFKKAKADLAAFDQQIASWQKQLDGLIAQKQGTLTPAKLVPAANSLQVPILLYHQTPADFEAQLKNLITKGYTAIDLEQLVGAMHKTGKLPAKPVVITYDDGFENQMTAFRLLEKYHQKATFYIIDGGAESNWCIGAGRQYHLASQPKTGCGDAYLNWDQVRTIDQSGLITIGAHTINHRALGSLNADQQWYEIYQGKLQLESELGHSVEDFAYPYGSFNQTTIRQVQKAGFQSAVTTLPGTYQVIGDVYTLHRVRSAYDLP